jgi:hypothetical protein
MLYLGKSTFYRRFIDFPTGEEQELLVPFLQD